MNTMAIGENVKKLREERDITQQQLADALGIAFQSISKWECNTTIPDVAMLPEIAEYFEVTIDSLFCETKKVYKHKAERLLAKYGSDIQNSDAFNNADNEYEKLFASGNYDRDDLKSYAKLNSLRMGYYSQKAEKYFLDSLEQGNDIKDTEYYHTQRDYIRFLAKQGRADERLEVQKEILDNEPDILGNYFSLAFVYYFTHKYQDALDVCKQALVNFPDDAELLLLVGDIYSKLKDYENAKMFWIKSHKLDPEMMPTLFSLAFYYRDNGYKDKAIASFKKIISWLERNGYRDDAKWIKGEVKKLQVD